MNTLAGVITFLVFCAGLAAYSSLIWLITPKGCYWAVPLYKALNYLIRRLVRPERLPAKEHGWLYGLRPCALTVLIYGPLIVVGLGAAELLTADLRYGLPVGTLFLMLCGRRITWMLEETPVVNRLVQASRKMSAQRMINDRAAQ